MQGRKTQAHSNTTFATRLLLSHCKITGFIISTSSFSPLGRKFCNISLLLRYTRGHEPLRTFNFNISICLWRFINKYETLYHGVNYLLVSSKGSKNLESQGKTYNLRTDKLLSAEFSDSIQQWAGSPMDPRRAATHSLLTDLQCPGRGCTPWAGPTVPDE